MQQLYKHFIWALFLLVAVFSACQKDKSAVKPVIDVDTLNVLNSRGSNYLATKGTLKITLQDSTYVFNAAQDSIAFVNVNIDGQPYYGITAINKAHTVSFGISSFGAAETGVAGTIAGSQFLKLNTDKSNSQFTLTTNVLPKDIGTISLAAYKQDSVLAKGAFKTYLSKDGKTTSPFYKAEGTFSLTAGSH